MTPRPRHAQSLKKANSRLRKLEAERNVLRQDREAANAKALRLHKRNLEMLDERNQTMSKRGFEIIALAVRESVVLEPAFAEEDPEGWRDARERFAEELADVLEATNVNFDRDRFLQEATR